jgi:TRAP-type C4-dicarboxylate transport system permease small subunit
MQNANGLTSKTIFSDAIDIAASWLAMFGGIVLLGILVMVSVSISLRALGMMPIQGDFELLQVGLAIVVGSFLPWCHAHGGNMFVDFVTKTLPTRRQCQLDAIAGLLVFIMLSIIAWRSGAGAIASKASGGNHNDSRVSHLDQLRTDGPWVSTHSHSRSRHWSEKMDGQ